MAGTLSTKGHPKTLMVGPTIQEAMQFWRSHWTILRRGILLGTFLGGLALFLDEIRTYFYSNAGFNYYDVLIGVVGMFECFLFLVCTEIFISLTISCHRLMLMRNVNDQYQKLFIDWLKESRILSFFFGNFTSEKKALYMLKELNFGCFIFLVYMAALVVLFFGQLAVGLFIENEVWKSIIPYVTVFPCFLYFIGRFSFASPALAVYEEDSEWSWREHLEWSWEETIGHGWKIAMLLGALPIIVGIAYEFLVLLGLQEIVILDSFLWSFLWFFFTPIVLYSHRSSHTLHRISRTHWLDSFSISSRTSARYLNPMLSLWSSYLRTHS